MVRVLSYNIHKGFSLNNTKFLLQQIREAIRLVKADVVFLQEVVGENHNHRLHIKAWPSQSQFEYLADEVWPHFAYGKNAVYTSGDHGNAILSKYPIVQWDNLNISTNSFEQRGLLHAVIEIPQLALNLDCICIHFDLLARGRKIQTEQLIDRVQATVPKKSPLLIAGDFNDWQVQCTQQIQSKLKCHELFLTLAGKHARTFPSFFPLLPLDRIYYRGLKPLDGQVLTGAPWNKLSDHAALFGEFTTITKH